MANYLKSTNFAVKDNLAINDAGRIVRGAEIDQEFNSIATAVASKADLNSPQFTGVPRAPTPNANAAGTEVATAAFVRAQGAGGVPSGAIVMWSGSVNNIPSGWLLCDGTNGTPNLLDRFILGAGGQFNTGVSGGFREVVLKAHTHGAIVQDGEHTHTFLDAYYADGQSGITPQPRGSGGPATTNAGVYSRVSNVATSRSNIAVQIEPTGTDVGLTNTNYPPFYALAFIIKI